MPIRNCLEHEANLGRGDRLRQSCSLVATDTAPHMTPSLQDIYMFLTNFMQMFAAERKGRTQISISLGDENWGADARRQIGTVSFFNFLSRMPVEQFSLAFPFLVLCKGWGMCTPVVSHRCLFSPSHFSSSPHSQQKIFTIKRTFQA